MNALSHVPKRSRSLATPSPCQRSQTSSRRGNFPSSGENVGTIKFEPRRRLHWLRLAASAPGMRFAKLQTTPTLVFVRSPWPPRAEAKGVRTSRRQELTVKTRVRASRSRLRSASRGFRPSFDLTAMMTVVLDQVVHGAADRERFVAVLDTEVVLPSSVIELS